LVVAGSVMVRVARRRVVGRGEVFGGVVVEGVVGVVVVVVEPPPG
jgi:hypothetical protein